MTQRRYLEKAADKAYITNNLLLPKQFINERAIKAALTYTLSDEEVVVDPNTGEAAGVKARTLELWDETRSHLIVPRDFIPPDQYHAFQCEFVTEPPPVFERVDIIDRIQLRNDAQLKAYEALINNRSGTLNLSCGSGKSVIALKVAATFKVPTIIIVNTTALLEQWKEEIQRHLGVQSVGVVQGTTKDWQHHPIVVAMVHTLSGKNNVWTPDFRKRFGLAIWDESHHISAPFFVRSADLFYGRRYSLTATAKRLDGMESIYQYHLGPIIHSNLDQDLIPETVFHVLKWVFPAQHKRLVQDKMGEVSLPRVRSYLGRLEWRNNFIQECLFQDLKEGRQVLVLSHSVKHVTALHNALSYIGSGMIVGSTPQEHRIPILTRCNPVIGTFQLAREGLNKPSLDTLYVVTPFSSPNDMQQAWGRIQRKYEGKKPPLVRVFEDLAFTSCSKSCNALRSALRKKSYPFTKQVKEIV